MSKVGNVDEMFGKSFSIVTTNASGSDILNDTSSSFVASSLIVASPVDANNNDLGYPTLLATDANGEPLRLTYTIKPGNGLVLAYTYASGKQDFSEVLSLAIDNDTIKTSEANGAGYLYVSATGITEFSQYIDVDSYNNIDVDIKELPDASRIVLADVPLNDEIAAPLVTRMTVDASQLIDNYTLTTNQTTAQAKLTYFANQKISVNLDNIIDNKSLVKVDGLNGNKVLGVNANFISNASPTSYGVVKIDNSTIKQNPNGQIYVTTSNLNKVTNNGGVGVVFVQKQGVGSIYADSMNGLTVDTSKMQKAGENNKFGVCAVDGVTITTNQNGVLKVISAGKVATKKSVGTVMPDNTTITVDDSGIIKVNASNLVKGSASDFGVVKYDNSTIVKNTQGQISVPKIKDIEVAISDLRTQIASFSEQLTAIKSELTNSISSITKITNATMSILTSQGKALERMDFHVPNVASYRGIVHRWESTDAGGTFTLRYAAGYVFSCRLNGGTNASWLQSCSIVVNGQEYGMNQDIKLSSNTATCSLVFAITGYPKNTTKPTQRSTASWSLEFRDQSGNPLKAISISIHCCPLIYYESQFRCTTNGISPTVSIADSRVVANSTKIADLITVSPIVASRGITLIPQILR